MSSLLIYVQTKEKEWLVSHVLSVPQESTPVHWRGASAKVIFIGPQIDLK
jgi:hypothetical protein